MPSRVRQHGQTGGGGGPESGGFLVVGTGMWGHVLCFVLVLSPARRLVAAGGWFRGDLKRGKGSLRIVRRDGRPDRYMYIL